MFKDFDKRLQRDVNKLCTSRLKDTEKLSGGKIKPKPMEVNVVTHNMQRYAVWFGGSMLASTPEFFKSCHTKAQYVGAVSQPCSPTALPNFRKIRIASLADDVGPLPAARFGRRAVICEPPLGRCPHQPPTAVDLTFSWS